MKRSRSDAVIVTDAFVAGFAIWTLLCNAVVAAGGSFTSLLLLSPVVVPAWALAVVALWRRPDAPAGEAWNRTGTPQPEPAFVPRRLLAICLGAAAAGALAEIGAAIVWVWAASLALLTLGFVTELRRQASPSAARPPLTRSWRTTLWILAFLGAMSQLWFHRASIDDSLYVSFTVQAIDQPHLPLLSFDALHGIAELPIILPVYRLVSFEMLAALISRLTGLAPLESHHWVLAALIGGLVPLAHARLFQSWTPQTWMASTLASLGVLLTMSGPARSYGNTTLVLLHQGKGAFLALLAPLLIAYAIEFARSPGPRTWALLCAAQIASLGMTATALWVAPLTVGLTLLAGLPWSVRSLRPLAAGLLTSAYPLLCGLALRAATREAVTPISPGVDSVDLMSAAADSLFGDGVLAGLGFATLAGVWVTCPPGLPRRLAVVLPLGFLLLLFNPATAAWMAASVTGEWTYFRVFWLLPLPLLMSLVATAPLRIAGTQGRLRGRWVLTGIAVLALGASTTPYFVYSPENDTRVEFLGLKVKPEAFAAASAIVEGSHPSHLVLAPESVSVWIGTLPRHPASVVPRWLYLDILRPTLGEEAFAWRSELAAPIERNIARRWRLPPGWAQAILARDVDTVCLWTKAHGSQVLGDTLAEIGFMKLADVDGHAIWQRRRSAEDSPRIAR